MVGVSFVCMAVATATSALRDTTGYANVIDFGAVGDGATDDILALERAAASVALTGGVIYLPPPHEFAISRPLVLTGYAITLRGGGAHPAGCVGRGSALVAITGNSSLVVIKGCDFCSVNGLLLTHAVAGGESSFNAAACTAATQAHRAAIVSRHRRRMAGRDLHTNQQLPPATLQSSTDAPRVVRVTPSSGAAIAIRDSFQVTVSDVWISDVWIAVLASEMANTVNVLDSQVANVFGPAGVWALGGGSGNMTRVDILQISRITTNNDVKTPSPNTSCVWIDIGAGVNTVRLDNVGLINGGIGVRMDSPSDQPAGEAPGRPLFLIANDLEIDFPRSAGLSLLRGEGAMLSNMYLQGSQTSSGLYVGPRWNSELMVTNSRIFGHHLSGIELWGGAHTLISNNVIGANSAAGVGVASGIFVATNVSDFIVSHNHVGDVFRGSSSAMSRWGVEIQKGSSDRYVVTGNTLVGAVNGGVFDGGDGSSKSVEGNVVG